MTRPGWLLALLFCYSSSACQPETQARAVGTLVDGRQLVFAQDLHQSQRLSESDQPRTGWKPSALSLDPSGTAWVADTEQHRILSITPTGVVSLYAGSSSQGAQDGPREQASFHTPQGIFWTPSGLLIADSGNARIRQISPSGQVSSLSFQQPLKRPIGVSQDAAGLIYVADAGRNQILRRGPKGEVEILQQLGTGSLLQGLALDAQERLLYLDNTGLWRWQPGQPDLLLPYGSVYTRFGGLLPWRDGVLLSEPYRHRLLFWQPHQVQALALLSEQADPQPRYPAALAADPQAPESFILGDLGQRRLRRLSEAEAGWQLSTLARSGTQGFGIRRDGQDLNLPHGILWDRSRQRLLVTDYSYHRLLEIDREGRVTPRLERDKTELPLTLPAGLAQGPGDEILISASGDHQIQLWPAQLQSQSQAPNRILAGSGQAGHQDGPAAEARFRLPWGLSSAPDGSVYVADHGNHVIRRISPQGQVSTVAGVPGQAGFRNGAGAQALFHHPSDVLYLSDGSLLVADSWNHNLRHISPEGRVTSFSGYQVPGLRDGHRHKALFYLPSGLAMGPQGSIYIADSWNHRIRELKPNGQVSSLAGRGRWLNWQSGSRDGTGHQALFNQPLALSVNPDNGHIYVADTSNHRVREIEP